MARENETLALERQDGKQVGAGGCLRHQSMPRGRHATKGTTRRATPVAGATEETSNAPFFRALNKTLPLLTLLFVSAQAQHAALSRIEAFYESHSGEKRYLTLDEAKQGRLCQHYEAFNFPLSTVVDWLRCMKQRHAPDDDRRDTQDSDSQAAPWWKVFCNIHEVHLLEHLATLGVLLEDEASLDGIAMDVPVYLISTLETKQAALQHERLHFLYYVSPRYGAQVQEEYQKLSAKTRKIIENDLTMRKYSPTVWLDEFQAYVSEDAGEFGKSIQEECRQVQSNLKALQRQLWKDLNVY